MEYNFRTTKSFVDTKQAVVSDAGWLDISDDVVQFSCRYGTRTGNNAGHVAQAGTANIVLDNGSAKGNGRYHMFAPKDTYDPLPGHRIEARYRRNPTWPWRLLWAGWAKTPTSLYEPNTADHVITEYEGALAKLESSYNEINVDVPGTVSTGFMIQATLDAVGWPFGRRIDSGRTRLHSWLTNEAEIFRGGVTGFASTTDAFEVMAAAEIGRIFDDHEGSVVFHDRTHRATAAAQRADYIIDNPQAAAQADIANAVINQIVADASRTTIHSTEFAPGLTGSLIDKFPVEIVCGANQTTQYRIRIDRDSNAVRITQPVISDPTPAAIASLGLVATASEAGNGDVIIGVLNPTPKDITLTINKLRGNIVRLDEGLEPRLIERRNQESIDRYGHRPLRFPSSIVNSGDLEATTGDATIQDTLDWILNTSSGTGNALDLAQLDINASILDRPDLIGVTVGDVIETSGVLGIGDTKNKFFVDEVQHTLIPTNALIRQNNTEIAVPSHDVLLKCTSVTPWGMFVIGSTSRGDLDQGIGRLGY